MAAKSLYEILELSATASPDAIQAAHERLSKKLDPESPENAGKPDVKVQFDAVKEAFLTLSNPEKRAKYDKALALRSQPALRNVEVIEPFWTMPKMIVLAIIVVFGGGYYYKHKQTEARLAAEKAIAVAKAKEAEEKARAEAELAKIEFQRREQERIAEDRARRESEVALRRFSAEQQVQSRVELTSANRERQEQQRAQSQRQREEQQAAAAAQTRLARDKAELCRIERERYGRAISC